MKFRLSYVFMVCILAAIVSCKKPNKTTDKPVVIKSLWQVDAKKSYASEEKVVIKFKNISPQALTIYDPLMVEVEQKLANEGSKTQWKKVRWLYCPCGASCPPPPRTMDIDQDQTKTFVWNKIEKWCDAQGKTAQQKATQGTYRLKLTYKNPKTSEREIHYQEFNIE
ncbi:hypothetical protein BKI52_24620 [marine bacterium AO1-C]|nr:hypothetical protein BKI52_24620 [marine bacterium AO1-C]